MKFKEMVDIFTEHCTPLKELAAALPVQRSYSTLYRYATEGMRIRNSDEVVKLESTIVGGEIYSSREAFERFINALNSRGVTEP